ncbi:plasmid replication protein RepC [Cereibacter sphaeroides]|uniref:plasmid replication protein RepC n=1 Tax=Cereibacter sphaeroides TaxID=1063 RepID=UPI00055A38DD|nr:plasmid replication protein RepC [Cereibacter sphaeroides]
MHHISLTPFGRQPVTAGILASQRLAEARSPLPEIDKWALFADLRTARARFGVSDRDLAVLYALLSFLPGRVLADAAPLVVFPSNATLSDRAHGMAESTLRRHLAALVEAGLVARRDSANGKRYAHRNRAGELVTAYGFDLRPLLVRAAEIAETAAALEAEAEAMARARTALVLKLRDATKLAAYADPEGRAAGIEPRLMPIRRALRRRLTLADLAEMARTLDLVLGDIRQVLVLRAAEMDGTVGRIERHHTESKTESSDLEGGHAGGKTSDGAEKSCRDIGGESPDEVANRPSSNRTEHDQSRPEKLASVEMNDNQRPAPTLPLGLVLKACPDLEPYAPEIRNWRDLTAAASRLRGMMGITPSAWEEAKAEMGAEAAAVALAAILQRFASIRNPGGYLRALTRRASEGAFSPTPMIMALLAETREAA